jgi:hypothetical protein
MRDDLASPSPNRSFGWQPGDQQAQAIAQLLERKAKADEDFRASRDAAVWPSNLVSGALIYLRRRN